MVAPLLTNPSNKVRVVDEEMSGPPRPEDVVRYSAPLSDVITGEFDGALEVIGYSAEEVLLAALGRSIARTIGVGVATVGGMTAVQPILLCCLSDRDVDADGQLARVRRALAAAPDITPGPADVVFSYLGLPPDPALGALQLADGPALGVLTYRADGAVQTDWWFDVRRLEPGTVEELAAQFRLGLIELTSEATVSSAATGAGHPA